MSAPPALHVRVSPRAAVYEVEDRLYLRLDAEGRWSAFAERGAVFRRAVDGSVLRARGAVFERLADEAAVVVHGWVGRRANALLAAVREAAAPDVVQGDPAAAAARLARAASWGHARLEAERSRYARAYPEPVPILPPHRYRDLVVLPATGCPHHGCRFCAFYRGRPFHVLGDAEFEAHLAAVRALFGRALEERDGIFLGSASALSLSDALLLRRLRRARAVLGHPRRGIAAFLDPDRAAPRTAVAWARLAEEGLVEAVLGLETAWGDLRARLGKSARLDRFEETVRAAKGGGLAVSVTVLVGIGDDADEEARHLEETIAFLTALPLGQGDLVYLSPRIDDEGRRHGDERQARARFEGRLAARLAPYRIDRFAWLA